MHERTRRCAMALNAFHSIIYFGPELDAELSRYGVTDSTAVYLAGRAAPLGAVGAGAVIAAFNAFASSLVATHLPSIWRSVSPAAVLAARIRAADAVFRRTLGADVLGSRDMAQAAALAWRAFRDCPRPGRLMASANLDLDVPDDPHLLLWHAATVAREYRGDGHVAVLADVELTGLDALVTDCASPTGMPKQLVMAKRGWTESDWAAAVGRLAERGLADDTGALTERGVRLRADVEAETDRLGRVPYECLGADNVECLTGLVEGFVRWAADSGAFPEILRSFFVPGG